MKISRLLTLWLLIFGLTAFAPPLLAGDLIFSAPPRETAAKGQKQYGPLADYLTKLLGKKVVYVHPGNWLTYERDMRADKYDLLFDGPHFVSWRILHLKNDVLARLPGPMDFYLIAKKSDAKINSLTDLVGKKFCGIPPPNLGTVAIIAAFSNPVQQPVVIGTKGGIPGAYKGLMDGLCRAAVVRVNFFKGKLSEKERANLKIIYATKPFPNQAITASQRVTERERNLIVQALTVGDGIKATMPTIKRYAPSAKHFIPAKAEDYAGLNSLLEGVIFGWE